MAHPPRSKPPLRSSSGPPIPCITPSTETLVVVVNLMSWSPRRTTAAGPFWIRVTPLLQPGTWQSTRRGRLEQKSGKSLGRPPTSETAHMPSDLWLCPSRGQDLNLRPLGYEPSELPDC